MDIDDPIDSLVQFFELSPDAFPWNDAVVRAIEQRRALMSDMLMFDIVLASAAIRDPESLYPPTDVRSLRRLLGAIEASTYDRLKKDSAFYFLLKWHKDGREQAFAEQRCILPQFAALADTYWHLDTGLDIARAISALSDERLVRGYTSKILQAISLSDQPLSLIRNYIRTVRPPLTQPNDIELYVVSLADSSLAEAWQYQRTFPEAGDMRKRLIHRILEWCLTPSPRALPLTHLLAIPFSPYEQTLVHAYALEPLANIPVPSIPIIQDLVCVRLVQSGQHAAAIKLDRQFSSVPRAGEKAQRAALERRQMLDELMAAMPAAERHLLELELEHFSQGGALPGTVSSDVSMSTSWEHIHAPSANGVAKSVSALPHIPISQRSGAPRFGGAIAASGEVSLSAAKRNDAAPPREPHPPLFPRVAASSVNTPSTSTRQGRGNAWAGRAAEDAVPRSGTLFETSGSANATPNAFYTPPQQPSASAKRAAPRASAGGAWANTSIRSRDASMREADDSADVSMLTELDDLVGHGDSEDAEHSRDGEADETQEEEREQSGAQTPEQEANDTVEESSQLDEAAVKDDARSTDGDADADAQDAQADYSFSHSVFSPPPEERQQPSWDPPARARTSTSAATRRQKQKQRPPPGAFSAHDEDEEEEAVSAPASRRTRRPPSPSPPPPPPPKTKAKASKRLREKDLSRSIPGSLMDDDDEDDEPEEEEDVVAPLPPVTPSRPRRKRESAGAANAAPTRRSSRLSIASSVGTLSPEPESPQKTRRSARASASGAGGRKGSGKTKR